MSTTIGKDHAFTWEIHEEQDRWEVRSFEAALFRRLARDTAALAARMGHGDAERAAARLTRWTGDVRVGPEHAWMTLLRVLEREDGGDREWALGRAQELLLSALDAGPPGPIATDGADRRPRWAVEALDRQATQLEQELGHDPQIVMGNPLSTRAEAMLRAAHDILGSVWPEAGGAMQRLVHEVIWISAPRFWSGSIPFAQGAMFVNPTEEWSVPHLFETLLHEGSHFSLNIKLTLDPLLLNPDEVTDSPIRTDPRPMKGILHAAFVLMRMSHGHARYVASARELPAKDTAARLYRDDRRRLGQAIDTLRRRGQLTARGAELLGSLERGAAELPS